MANDVRAIVRPSVARQKFSLEQWAPDASLGRFVSRFWRTAWNLPEPFVQTIVTHPVVNLVFQSDGSAVVSGVQHNNDGRHLEGSGWALGVMFRPGGFRPLIEASMTTLTDRRLPATAIFGPVVTHLTAAVLAAPMDQGRIDLITAFLLERVPTTATIGEDISTLVERAATATPPVTRVSELARSYGVSVRTLQRVFAEHVGVSPKCVLDRYRLLATAEATLAPVRSWADIAHQLGYADQAHLTSTFATTYGSPPATYARDESRPDDDITPEPARHLDAT
jgi:AraC-like DNA-binding protein